MPKEFKIKVRGRAYTLANGEPELVMADMLRYDEGVIESVTPIEEPGRATPNTFEAVVRSKYYTPRRWDSFMLKTEILEEGVPYNHR